MSTTISEEPEEVEVEDKEVKEDKVEHVVDQVR